MTESPLNVPLQLAASGAMLACVRRKDKPDHSEVGYVPSALSVTISPGFPPSDHSEVGYVHSALSVTISPGFPPSDHSETFH
ncbi:unnamed protein product [Arctogadus glacialis]